MPQISGLKEDMENIGLAFTWFRLQECFLREINTHLAHDAMIWKGRT
jgi:hypothetical protein